MLRGSVVSRIIVKKVIRSLCCGIIFGSLSGFAQEKQPESLFGLTNIVDVHLELDSGEWAKLQPPAGTSTGLPAIMLAFEDMMKDAAEGEHFWSENSTRPGLAGYLGVDHQYGRAHATIDGDSIPDIGLRYKGNGTFLEGFGANKLSLKLDFNEYEDDQEFRGLKKINLNNCITDPSMLREALSYELFREAGIPSSRVGFARVNISVPGELEDKSFGLYTVVEQVDKRFLKDRYGSSKGLLMKPSTFGVFRYLGENWDDYAMGYIPKTEPTVEQQQRVIKFARLLNQADDQAFDEQVDGYLDVDQFLRFVAVNVLLSNLDSFLGGTQNHYVYLEPESNKFQFIPWDMDHSFGAFFLEGSADQRRDISIDRPGGKRNLLIERVLKIDRHKETYHGYLDEYLGTLFDEDKMHRQISDAADFLRPLIAANGADAPKRFENIVGDGQRKGEAHPMKYFVTKRRESVRAQLDGNHTGHVPFMADIEPFPVRKMIGFAGAFLLLLLLSLVGWIWGMITGFKGSTGWGILNIFLFPVAPMIYGFGVRKDLGRRSAWWATLCAAGFAIWLVTAIIMFN